MKLFNFRKKRKTIWSYIAGIPVSFKIMGILVIILFISITASGLRFKTEAQEGVFNKIVYYDAVNDIWKNFASSGEEIVGLSLDTLGYMIFASTTDVYRVSWDGTNTGVPQPLSNYPGNKNNIVDVVSGVANTYVLEKDGQIHYTMNSGASWNSLGVYSKPSFVNNNAEAIGTDGATAVTILYGGGNIGYVTGLNTWYDFGKTYGASTYGTANSVEWSQIGYIMISTDMGYLLQSATGGAGDWTLLSYKSPGEFIFDGLEHNGAYYLFASALNESRSTVGFMYWGGSGSPSLIAVIPGCVVKKTSVILVEGVLSYVAVISDVCDPNDPEIPEPECPPAGEGDVYNYTNEYDFEYKGVSVHTKVVGPDGETATARSGDEVTFTLTVNNPESAAKSTDVRFTLPPGFTYVAGSASNSSFSQAGQVMTWSGYSAPVGDSTITLRALVP